jgi:hypothetical protein
VSRGVSSGVNTQDDGASTRMTYTQYAKCERVTVL